MKDFMTLARERYSVRKLKSDPIPEEAIAAIVEAGRIAPTAANRQPQRIFVLKSQEALDKLKLCTRSHFNCPLAFIIAFDKNECWVRPFDGKGSGDIDASIVTTHMMLAAWDLGIGSTWVMFYEPDKVQANFDIPENLETTAILVMGYAADDAEPAKGHLEKKPEAETVQVL